MRVQYINQWANGVEGYAHKFVRLYEDAKQLSPTREVDILVARGCVEGGSRSDFNGVDIRGMSSG